MTTSTDEFDAINAALSSYEPRRDKHQKNLAELAKKTADSSYIPAFDLSGYVLPYIAEWQSGIVYDPGTVVTHRGSRYLKLDDGDNSMPDAVPGGWVAVNG